MNQGEEYENDNKYHFKIVGILTTAQLFVKLGFAVSIYIRDQTNDDIVHIVLAVFHIVSFLISHCCKKLFSEYASISHWISLDLDSVGLVLQILESKDRNDTYKLLAAYVFKTLPIIANIFVIIVHCCRCCRNRANPPNRTYRRNSNHNNHQERQPQSQVQLQDRRVR